jgi:hypothetical protein
VKFFATVPLLFFLACAMAQEKNPPPQKDGIKVEVLLTRPKFVLGESVQYKLLLINETSSPIYISKYFGVDKCSGKAKSGFSVEVKQISGKMPTGGCGCGGGIGYSETARSPEDILKEDFILLYPMQFVGVIAQYESCNIEHPGIYEITARYSIDKTKVEMLASLIQSPQILDSAVKSSPIRFRVVAKKLKK